METKEPTEIGVKFRNPNDNKKMLTVVRKPRSCIEHSYLIDENEPLVSCANCKGLFTPMQVLVDLARRESRFMENWSRYNESMKRLSERSKTKCNFCGKMTRISKR